MQEVCFRDATRRMADSLGVCGSAINLSDGSVEVIIYGNQADVDALCAWLWHGSEMAQVQSVQCVKFKEPLINS